jgi:hypothetical protein
MSSFAFGFEDGSVKLRNRLFCFSSECVHAYDRRGLFDGRRTWLLAWNHCW